MTRFLLILALIIQGSFLPSSKADPRLTEYRNIAQHLANRFTTLVGGQLDYDDLFSVAMLALWQATLDYRENEHAEFSTFAYRCVFNALSHEQQRVWRARRRTWMKARSLDADEAERSLALTSSLPTPEQAYATVEAARAVLGATKPKNHPLVMALLQGGSLQDAADTRGLSREQARMIFKNACTKTRRQVARKERRA